MALVACTVIIVTTISMLILIVRANRKLLKRLRDTQSRLNQIPGIRISDDGDETLVTKNISYTPI